MGKSFGKFGVIGTMDRWKKGDQANNQMLNIVLNSCSKTKEDINITPTLASAPEVDYEIDALISELENIRVYAKRNIVETNKKTKNRN